MKHDYVTKYVLPLAFISTDVLQSILRVPAATDGLKT
jgi:hypothetical protein